MTPTMRAALEKWSDGSCAPKYKNVQWKTARALWERGYLATPHGLPFTKTNMVLAITKEGVAALETEQK